MHDDVKLSTSDVHILNICRKIEETCAQLYHYFARLHGDTPEAGALWEKTAQEEENHAEQFRLAYRLHGSGMESLNLDIRKADALHGKILAAYEAVQQTPPPFKEALRFAIKLEQSMADYHMATVANFREKSLARLFTSMMKCDNQHIGMLEQALKELEAAG